MKRHLVTLAAAAAFVSSAYAQVPSMKLKGRHLKSSLSGVEALTACDIDNDQTNDAALLDPVTGELCFLWCPQLFSWLARSGITGLTGITCFPTVDGGALQTDTIFAVGSGAPKLIDFDGTLIREVNLVGSWTAWGGSVTSTYDPVTDSYPVAGLNGNVLKTGRWTPAGAAVGYLLLTIPGAQQVFFADIMDNGVESVVVRTSYTLEVYDLQDADGLPNLTIPIPGGGPEPAGFACGYETTTGPRVAWLHPSTGATWRLAEYEGGSLVTGSGQTTTFPAEPVGLDAGDLDGSGDDSLVVFLHDATAGTQPQKVAVLLPAGGLIGLSPPLIAEVGSRSAGDLGMGIVLDVDNDWSGAGGSLADILVGASSEDRFDMGIVTMSQSAPPEVLPITPTTPGEGSVPDGLNDVEMTDYAEQPSVKLQVFIPDLSWETTHIEVRMWHQEIGSGTPGPITLTNELYKTLPSGPKVSFVARLTHITGSTIFTANEIHYLTVRFVNYDETNDKVLKASKSLLFAVMGKLGQYSGTSSEALFDVMEAHLESAPDEDDRIGVRIQSVGVNRAEGVGVVLTRDVEVPGDDLPLPPVGG